ncbi:MAG: helix-turn-helix transcriptional regulator [Alphaproteobacteria bacterium]|jgi:ribosome-binding protein aMBF1 (putative translation factor)|nr:helix-turn-helix transcriptional regulator [Alphaproteobacteria bacterium]MDP6591307.1 helix-turn-helix transcriptional regulator [Alphaproteobacteria bacterium]MDP6818291.1 helix-turn-helix transcriptional regulator [Alphaproteobacteria bacterium]|tara:strand:- start:842 stop:1126 length:285 start_codon:yes stop_codon:yes gene_type:complete
MADIAFKDLKAKLLSNPEARKVYDDLAPEYAVARAVIKARKARGLTQAELAERMNTSQSFIARIENARSRPTIKTLYRVAAATGTRVKLDLVST